MEKGYTHIYYGDGKGKTTAGMGLSIRCAGSGFKVFIYQALKVSTSGEINSLKNIENIHIYENYDKVDFTFNMTDDEKVEFKKQQTGKFKDVVEVIEKNSFDLVFLDELLTASNLGMINKQMLLDFLDNKPEKMEVVITGHKFDEDIFKRSDYITKMCKEKHPFENGISARLGIEF